MPPKDSIDDKDTNGETKPENEIMQSPDYYDEEGDLEIISSDRVKFKISAFYLQASSLVNTF